MVTQIQVGIAGLGRSGWNIHAPTISQLPDLFRVAAVCDADPTRRDEAIARFNCRAYDSVDGLCNDPGVDLVVVATPSSLHANHVETAFATGKHVLCEKPVALTVADLDRMVVAAQQANRVLAPFHNLRYDPAFEKIREIIDSGQLGRIVHIRMAMSQFTRRWDWQTLAAHGGGSLNNAGPHFLDRALDLLGPAEPHVFCHLDRVLSCGDTEDHVVILLKAPQAPLIEVMISAACVYPQSEWLVMGSQGGLVGTKGHLQWKTVDTSLAPPRSADSGPAAGRSYAVENFEATEHQWGSTVPLPGQTPACRLYRDVHGAITQGTSLRVTVQSVRRCLTVLEQCRALCPQV